MKNTVIVFARAPRLGAVKQRLARDVGARAALRFHLSTLNRLLRALYADRRYRTYLAATPDRARFRISVPLPRMGQGHGDLGRRMHRACGRFVRGRVAIIGSDIPSADAGDVAVAFAALGRADAVFGPAEDGGYWLVALGPRRPARPFACVRWSSEYALADTLVNFKGREVGFVRRLQDVDSGADLAKLRR